jgi:cytochrome oxidase Cu insertion factor (SCO1/SenC/PrrC family)
MGKSRQRKLARRAALPPRVSKPVDWKLFGIPLVVVAVLLGGGLIVRNTLTSGTPRARVTQSTTPAPTFTVATVNGPRFSLAAQRGRPVVLYFMAAWCTSCLAESNALGQIQQKYGDRVRIALVDIDDKVDTPAALRAFVARSGGPSRYWVLDRHTAIAQTYGVQALDTTYVINRQGGIAYSNNRPIDYQTLDQLVGQLV